MTDADVKLIDDAILVLREHWECVQIMVSRVNEEEEGTETIIRGKGNFWARKGLAQDFIDRENQEEAASKIAEKIKEDE